MRIINRACGVAGHGLRPGRADPSGHEIRLNTGQGPIDPKSRKVPGACAFAHLGGASPRRARMVQVEALGQEGLRREKMKRTEQLFSRSRALLSAWLPALAADDVLSLESNQKFLDDNKIRKGVITRPSGLQFRILQNGFGKRPAPTDTVKVYYTGRLINGVIFDGTSPGLPASMKLNSVIPGWIEALLQLMREGDHWQARDPAEPGLWRARRSPFGLIPPIRPPGVRHPADRNHAGAQEGRQGLPARSRRQGRRTIA